MDSLFALVTLAPLVVWVAMLLFPRSHFTQRLVLSYWPYLIGGGIWALLLLVLLADRFADLGLSLSSVQTLLSSDIGAVVLWSHLQLFDLFVGVWIFRDAKYWGINPGLFLLATLVAGPIGLGAYCWLRIRRERQGKDGARVVN